MKGKRKGLLLGMLLLFALCVSSVTALAVTAQTTEAATTTKKNGLVKEKNGKRYYYVNGKKVVNKWKTVNKKKYYFGADGAAKTGWYSIGKKSYYFDSNGVYKKSKAMDQTLLKKMDAVIKKYVKSKDSKNTALTKLFKYMSNKKNFTYGRAMGFNALKAPKGWESKFAKEMLTKKKGSCYHDAAAFAFLAKRATGYPVRICLGQCTFQGKNKWQLHGWVEIKISGTWRTFDTSAARQSPYRKGKWFNQKSSSLKNKVYKVQKYINVEL